MSDIPTLVPPGHFYSPICDPADLKSRRSQIWPQPLQEAFDLSFDYNIAAQCALLSQWERYAADLEFPEHPTSDLTQYFYTNGQFPYVDAHVLACLIRHVRPRAIVEIGSGFSTLVMADINRRHFASTIELTCVEPFPRQFLTDGVPGVSDLVRQRVQDIPLDRFEHLREGDILFIDSSHISKTGSDVNHIVFEILPRLHAGVYVHFHDIFLPDDYPEEWAIEHGRNWNEQYLIRAFLQFNAAFEIVWGSWAMVTRRTALVEKVFPRRAALPGAGSYWMRRKPG